MYVRLAHEWTGPDQARHGAGELIEVDNVTLAELEAGGFVATDEEDTERTRDTQRSDPTAAEGQDAGRAKDDDKGSGGSHPDSASWPPVT